MYLGVTFPQFCVFPCISTAYHSWVGGNGACMFLSFHHFLIYRIQEGIIKTSKCVLIREDLCPFSLSFLFHHFLIYRIQEGMIRTSKCVLIREDLCPFSLSFLNFHCTFCKVRLGVEESKKDEVP